MSEDEATREAEKRERHKSKHMANKCWSAVHDSVKGWHVALVDSPIAVEREAFRRAREAFHAGDNAALLDAAGDLLMARVRSQLAGIGEGK